MLLLPSDRSSLSDRATPWATVLQPDPPWPKNSVVPVATPEHNVREIPDNLSTV
jgi:hypothetical protein